MPKSLLFVWSLGLGLLDSAHTYLQGQMKATENRRTRGSGGGRRGTTSRGGQRFIWDFDYMFTNYISKNNLPEGCSTGDCSKTANAVLFVEMIVGEIVVKSPYKKIEAAERRSGRSLFPLRRALQHLFPYGCSHAAGSLGTRGHRGSGMKKAKQSLEIVAENIMPLIDKYACTY